MLDIINKLAQHRLTEVDNFLSFIGIYEDKTRERALRKLILENRDLVKGKAVVEAGAGLGNITQFLLDRGARRIFAVEENKYCVRFLRDRFARDRRVLVINERIEDFKPPQEQGIDLLFQELYGPLLLDESLLSLERVRFSPGAVVPDGGLILAEAAYVKDAHDPVVDSRILRLLDGALITDLFPNFKFSHPFVVGSWKFKRGRRNTAFKCKVKGKGDLLVLGMEVRHGLKRVVGTQESTNWPFVFSSLKSERFDLSFRYRNGFTQVHFKWL